MCKQFINKYSIINLQIYQNEVYNIRIFPIHVLFFIVTSVRNVKFFHLIVLIKMQVDSVLHFVTILCPNCVHGSMGTILA